MRRLISRLLMSLATTCAGIALTAHVFDVVAFDPGRPARVLAAMLATDQGKSLAAEGISHQLQMLDPQIGSRRADTIGHRVVTDPHLSEVLKAGGKGDPMSAVLDAVASVDPNLAARARHQLAGHQSKTSPSTIAFPSVDRLLAGHSVSGEVSVARSWLVTIAWDGLWAAFTLAGGALLLGPGRDLLLRHAGRWLLAASMAGVVLWLLLPDVVLPRLGGRWPVVVAAGLHAAGLGLAAMFVALFAGGLLALVAGHAAAYLVPLLSPGEVPLEIRREAVRRGRERAAATGR